MMARSSARLGVSAAAREVEADIALAARIDAGVLISGERGVGKEAIARLIHARSRRRQALFVPVRCTGASEPLLASELFGPLGAGPDASEPRRGALECADGGTLFLAGIGYAGPRVQERLLGAIEAQALGRGRTRPRPPDARFMASTEPSLLHRIADGGFREELFYRLNVVHITVPALRDRREDIVGLFIDTLARLAAEGDRHMPELSAEAWQSLFDYDWPGNLAEMRHVARRLLGQARGDRIGVGDLPPEIVPIATSWRVHHV